MNGLSSVSKGLSRPGLLAGMRPAPSVGQTGERAQERVRQEVFTLAMQRDNEGIAKRYWGHS